MTAGKKHYAGLILAGGRGTRAGGEDKGLLEYQGRALVEFSIQALQPFCDPLFINCNRNQDRYARYGLPLLSDPDDSHPGPLRALAQLLPHLPDKDLITLPCDTPGVRSEHIQQLIDGSRSQPGHWIYAAAAGRDHPLHAILPASLIPELTALVADTGETRLMRALAQLPSVRVDIDDAFDLNLNRPLKKNEQIGKN
ncbi:Molybdopterin-guanine dinucleotide biosynthesis protein MobA [Marinobacterium lacunae]|uniref:Molybdenum cofactor guanylyltransferase n=1 Tax=Marinobacterium lacunae TaxID=1232683 RepID=A0A081G177_9GAMM|nr:molybdenum cofactor guanylyltransferase [Marinobacterium lacunae]KEA64532.1 Molybdopterin-guanine dinucleotide biosynthesis protein MobA [Marinobacterium lacunae]